MIVQIIFIIGGFIIAISYPLGIEPLTFLPLDIYTTLRALILICLSSLLYILLGMNLVRKHLKILYPKLEQLSQSKGGEDELSDSLKRQIQNILAPYYRRVFNYRILLLLIYSIQVYIFHLPILSRIVISDQLPFIANLFTLLPFFITLVLSYTPFYWMERFQHYLQSIIGFSDNQNETPPTFSNYLAFQARTYFLLAILPLMVFMLFFDIIHMIPSIRDCLIIYPFIEWFISLTLILIMYIVAPFIIKYLWATKPLSESPLRMYLKILSSRARVKVKDFLVWDVGQRPFANALLIGLFPFNRFIIFTNTILQKLSNDEIATVSAHELGHAKAHHLLLLLLFTIAYLSILFSLNSIISNIVGEGVWNLTGSIFFLIIFWVILFGKLSRRFELEADWYAVRITSDPVGFTNALTKIAYLNGIPLRTSGLSTITHPSIDKRIMAIKNPTENGTDAKPPFIKNIVPTLIIVCLLGLLGIGYAISKDINTVSERRQKLKATEMVNKGYILLEELTSQADSCGNSETERKDKLQRAIFYLNSAIKLDATRSLYYILLGDALNHSGEYSESLRAYEIANKLAPVDPMERYYLSRKFR
ncbi:MAG: M48 family metalloprotease [Planctomycetota bacterium]|nr:M48 family metalloprotease [Planctomycetota bacterium]MDI6787121.1 M48 family metalloprotease [Planctomycetota bacterium]